MLSNREISKLFTLYAELLLLHKKDERLAALLSGAAYRVRNITESVTALNNKELSAIFRSEIVNPPGAIKFKIRAFDSADKELRIANPGPFIIE